MWLSLQSIKPFLFTHGGSLKPTPTLVEDAAALANIRVRVTHLAAQHRPYAHLIHRSTRLPCMVPCQLLPDGLDRPTVCGKIWREQDRGMDERLRRRWSDDRLLEPP